MRPSADAGARSGVVKKRKRNLPKKWVPGAAPPGMKIPPRRQPAYKKTNLPWLEADPEAWSWRAEMGIIGLERPYAHPVSSYWRSRDPHKQALALHVMRELVVRSEGQIPVMAAILESSLCAIFAIIKKMDARPIDDGPSLRAHAAKLRIKYKHSGSTGQGAPPRAGSKHGLKNARKALRLAFLKP